MSTRCVSKVSDLPSYLCAKTSKQCVCGTGVTSSLHKTCECVSHLQDTLVHEHCAFVYKHVFMFVAFCHCKKDGKIETTNLY